MQSYVVFANTDAFEAAGVEVPTGETLAWDDFEALAAEADDGRRLRPRLGAALADRDGHEPGPRLRRHFFTTEGENVTFEAGDAEMEVPRRIHDMAYEDESLDPVSLTLSGVDTLPGFIGGDYAMYVGGNFIAQQLIETAPEDFNWAVLPPLAGTEGANQAANPQTLSVAAESEHVEEAAAFINYFMDAENLAAVAEGDWLIPSSGAARDAVLEATGGENGWDAILASGDCLVAAPFQSASTTRSGRTRSPPRRSSSTSPTRSASRTCKPSSPTAGTRSPAAEQLPDGTAGGSAIPGTAQRKLRRRRPAGRTHGHTARPRRAARSPAPPWATPSAGPPRATPPTTSRQRYGGYITGIVAAVPRGLAQRPADRAVPQGRRPHHRRHADDARARRRLRRGRATTSTPTPSPSTSCRC